MNVIVRDSTRVVSSIARRQLSPILSAPIPTTGTAAQTSVAPANTMAAELLLQSRNRNKDHPRVLLVIDKSGWAFHNISLQVERHLSAEFDVQIIMIADAGAAENECDILVAFWWGSLPRLLQKIQARCVVTCIYDSYAWRAKAKASYDMDFVLANSDLLAVGNEQIARLLLERDEHLAISVVEDGVDTTMFWPRPFPKTFTIGWTGNSMGAKLAANIDDLKGVNLIVEACRLADVHLETRDYQDGTWPHAEMPTWYSGISAYVCASSCEGTPNPVLESMSCGRPVISTDVGLTRRIIIDGVNGFIVPRTAQSIADAIEKLKRSDLERMGRIARATAEPHDWRIKVKSWSACLRAAVGMSHGRENGNA